MLWGHMREENPQHNFNSSKPGNPNTKATNKVCAWSGAILQPLARKVKPEKPPGKGRGEGV